MIWLIDALIALAIAALAPEQSLVWLARLTLLSFAVTSLWVAVVERSRRIG